VHEHVPLRLRSLAFASVIQIEIHGCNNIVLWPCFIARAFPRFRPAVAVHATTVRTTAVGGARSAEPLHPLHGQSRKISHVLTPFFVVFSVYYTRLAVAVGYALRIGFRLHCSLRTTLPLVVTGILLTALTLLVSPC